MADKQKQSLETLREQARLHSQITNELRNQARSEEDIKEVRERELDYLKQSVQIVERSIDLLKEEGNLTKELLADRVALIKKFKNKIKEQEEYNKRVEEHAKRVEEAQETFLERGREVVSVMFGINNAYETTAMHAAEVALQMGVLGDSIKQLGKESTLNFFPSMMMKVQESTLAFAHAQDEARASFVQTTGQTDEQIKVVQDLGREYRAFGVTQESISRSAAALAQQMRIFNDISDEQRTRLVANAAMLEQFGVHADSIASISADLNILFGMGAEETSKFSRELVALSGAGLTAEQSVEGFGEALPSIAQHGREAIEVYKGLASATRILQTDTQELLGIVGQFDTFEGAANSVGRLNSVLGGDYFNSVELLNAKEDERIELLLEGVEASNKSWETMSRFERMALANAAGIEDMATASKLFNQSLTEYRSQQNDILSKGLSEEELKERARMAQTLLDDLKFVAETFAISIGPVVSGIRDVVTWYGELDASTRKITDGMIGVVSVVSLLGFGLQKLLGWVPKLISGLTASAAATTADTAAKTGNVAATQAMGAAAKANAAKIAAMGVAVAGLGIGVGAAAVGLGQLAKGIENLNNDQLNTLMATTGILVGSMAAMAIGLVAVGSASAAAAGPILAVGGALLMAGGGIAIAANGLSVLAESLSELSPELVDSIGGLLLSIAAMAPGAPLMLISAGAIGMLGTSIYGLSKALQDFDVESLREINNLLENISTLDAKNVAQMGVVVNKVREVVKITNDADSSNLERVVNILAQPAAQPAAAQGPATTENNNKTIEVNLNLDGRVFRKYIIDTVNGKASLRNNK